MVRFIFIASGFVCFLYACSFDVDVNHKGIPKSFEHEINAPGIFATNPQPVQKGTDDAGVDADADAADAPAD